MNYSEITLYIRELASLSDMSNHIVPELYAEHDVKRGLRDINGNGVVAGLAEISRIKAKDKNPKGNEILCEGQLIIGGSMYGILSKDFLTMTARGLKKQFPLSQLRSVLSRAPDTAVRISRLCRCSMI